MVLRSAGSDVHARAPFERGGSMLARAAMAANSAGLSRTPSSDALKSDDWMPVESARSSEGSGEAKAPKPTPSEALAAALAAATAKSRSKPPIVGGPTRRRAGSPAKDAPSASGAVRYTDARRLASALSFMGTLAPDGDGLPHVGPRRGSAVSALGGPPEALIHPPRHASASPHDRDAAVMMRTASLARVKSILDIQVNGWAVG